MDTQGLLHYLEYTDSPYFLTDSRLYSHAAFSHVFNQAKEKCGLQGVFILANETKLGAIGDSIIPAVYVCEATSEESAIELHKTIWNQNTVPFLIVVSPKCFRLYPGFKYNTGRNEEGNQEIFKIAKDANSVLAKFAELRARAINSGILLFLGSFKSGGST